MGRARRFEDDFSPVVTHKKGRPRSTAELLELRPAEPPDSLRSTMVRCLESFSVANLSTSTVSSRALDFRRFALWCEERALHRPADVTRPILERFQRHLFYYRKKNGQPLSVTRQHVVLCHVKSYFRWATRAGLLLANPAADLVLPKRPMRLPRYTLTVAEVEKVLAAPDVETLIGLRDRAMLEVLWATGVRRSELAQLSLWDVQWERGTVFVREGKGKKDRVVPISARALSWVRRYVDEVRPRYAVASDCGRLFLSESGEELKADSLSALVGDFVKRAGLAAQGACHLFRHACATQMLEGGADVRFVQELLGHRSLETTQVYTRVAISKLKAVYAATHPAASEQATATSDAAADAGELLGELEREAQGELDAGE